MRRSNSNSCEIARWIAIAACTASAGSSKAAENVVPVPVFERRGELGRADDVGEHEGLHDNLREVAHERLRDAFGVADGGETLEARGSGLELPDGGLLVPAGP